MPLFIHSPVGRRLRLITIDQSTAVGGEHRVYQIMNRRAVAPSKRRECAIEPGGEVGVIGLECPGETLTPCR